VKTPIQETATAGAKSSPKTSAKERLSRDGKWKYFSNVHNLIQYTKTDTYYARIKVGRKNVRKRLESAQGEAILDFQEARRALPDAIKAIRENAAPAGTFAFYQAKYEAAIKSDHKLAPGTKRYRKFCLNALKLTWPDLAGLQVGKITLADCQAWANRFLTPGKEDENGYDEQYFNNSLGTLRAVLELAGIRRDNNPAFKIKRLGVPPKKLQLPEGSQFEQIVQAIENSGFKGCKERADLVRFLAYSGCRISEAADVQWSDVKLEAKGGRVTVRNAKRKKTSDVPRERHVPLNPDLMHLLLRLRNQRSAIITELGKRAVRDYSPRIETHVCVATECEKSLTSACKKVGAHRITHHDLRHLFATRCIESGVDIQTVARWLGHVDGGALAMKVYGHLRTEHSEAMAQKVSFGSAPANIAELPFAPAAGGEA
jgi:integrase